MRKATAVLFFIAVLLLASTSFSPRVSTQDCFVQIISVNLNKSTLSIGERFQANITYNLYYDSTDPFGIGAVSISISTSSGGPPIQIEEFTELGANVEKTVAIDIMPQDWEPSEGGEIGSIQVLGWVQDSYNSMTDQITKDFWVIRSETNLFVEDTPDSMIHHDILNVTAYLTNPHNNTIPLANHEVCVSVTNSSQLIQTWNLNTSGDGCFTKLVDTTLLGTGRFSYNVTSLPNEDYLEASYLAQFNITKTSIQLNADLNATAYQAYFQSMNNVTAMISVEAFCQKKIHDMSEANITWSMDGREGELLHQNGTLFRGEVRTPTIPGIYNITITTTLVHHNISSTRIPLIVEPRRAVLSFNANCTEAAYGDFVNLSLTVTDSGCAKPVSGKIVGLFVMDHSDWYIIAQLLLDDNGFTSFYWQARDTGNDEFRFRALFEGQPEYPVQEQIITVDNTQTIRFHIDTIIEGIRGTLTNCTLQITTLDNVPIPNLTLYLVEVDTDNTWCTAETNASGHSTLFWYIPNDYNVGIHQFSMVCLDSLEIIGVISITMIVYTFTRVLIYY
jgi:hypothetical protein